MLTSESIEESIKKQIRQPKIWIHKQKSVPTPHKYAHSSRCVFCISIQHISEKCSQKQNPPLLKVEPKE